MTVAEQDLLAILDYIDGRLSTEEQLSLELRFTNDPELAAAFESFEAMDQLERQTARAKCRPAPGRLTPVRRRVVWFAAAAVLAVSAGMLLMQGLSDRPDSLTCELAVLPSAKNWLDFNGKLELGEQWIDLDPGLNRGGNRDASEHREYFEHIGPLQEARLAEALALTGEPAHAEFFNVVLRPASDCSVVVLVYDVRGEVSDRVGEPYRPAYPVDEGWTGETGRLLADRLAVLPARNARWDEASADVVPYDPGFLVPAGAERLEVLIGLRATVLDAQLESSLDALLDELSQASPDPQVTSSRLLAWFTDAGFDVLQTEVLEP